MAVSTAAEAEMHNTVEVEAEDDLGESRLSAVKSRVKEAAGYADAKSLQDGVVREMGQMTTMNRLVVGGVTLAVGVLVYNEVVGALPNSGGAINQTAIDGTVESAFQLAPVALIVLISAVILRQVDAF